MKNALKLLEEYSVLDNSSLAKPLNMLLTIIKYKRMHYELISTKLKSNIQMHKHKKKQEKKPVNYQYLIKLNIHNKTIS